MEKLKAIHTNDTPSREEAEKAVETLLRYIGEDPNRPGLVETPARMVRAFDEHYAGYHMNAADELSKTFEDIEGYDDFVLVRNIEFVSHCEHHLEPIIGTAHVAYWPDQKIVGISKLARIVDIYAKRLISQEMMTKHIADVLDETLQPKGIAIMVDASHQCMSTRGVKKPSSSTTTSIFRGEMQKEVQQSRFMAMIAAS